jgi:hypothetical protein
MAIRIQHKSMIEKPICKRQQGICTYIPFSQVMAFPTLYNFILHTHSHVTVQYPHEYLECYWYCVRIVPINI